MGSDSGDESRKWVTVPNAAVFRFQSSRTFVLSGALILDEAIMSFARFSRFGLVAVLALASAAVAQQGGSSKARPATKAAPATSGAVKSIDARVSKLQESFLRETFDIAKQYEMVGQFERAKSMYETLLKLDETLPGVKEKVEQLTEQMFEAIEFEYELDVSKGWVQPGAYALAKRAARIAANGSYEFNLGTKASPEGFRNEDPTSGLIDGIPVGTLVGMLLVDGKPTKPFAIGSSHEWTPEKNGLLMLKINAPSGHRSTGTLKVKLSGFGRLSNR